MTNDKLYIVNVYDTANEKELLESYAYKNLEDATNQMEEIEKSKHIIPNRISELVY